MRQINKKKIIKCKEATSMQQSAGQQSIGQQQGIGLTRLFDSERD